MRFFQKEIFSALPCVHCEAGRLRFFPSRLTQPVDFDFLFERFEFRVAGDEFGFFFSSECSGRRRLRPGLDFEAGLEIGGGIGQRTLCGMKFQRQAFEHVGGLCPCLRAIFLQEHVFYLGVVHLGQPVSSAV